MIVTCTECQGKVSTEAAACPHCGAPRKLWTSIDEAKPKQETTKVAMPVVTIPIPPPPAPEPVRNIPVEKPRFWRRMMPTKRAARVIVVQQPKMAADRIITPARTFQHATAGGFGVSFGWAMGGCAAFLVIALVLAGASWGLYIYATRHQLPNQGNPIPMERKAYGTNSCPRCNGIGYVEAQGDGIGMKCPRCSGSGLR